MRIIERKYGWIFISAIVALSLLIPTGCNSDSSFDRYSSPWDGNGYEVTVVDVYWEPFFEGWRPGVQYAYHKKERTWQFYSQDEPSYDQYGRLILTNVWIGYPEEESPSNFSKKLILPVGVEDAVTIKKVSREKDV